MYKSLLIIFFIFVSANLACRAGDTIPVKIKKNKLIFNFDNRNTFVRDESVKLWGFRTGIERNKKMRYGIAFYYNFLPLEIKNTTVKAFDDAQVNTEILFGYIAPYAEYLIFNKEKWELTVPFEIGASLAQIKIYNKERTDILKNNQRTGIVGETGITGQYRLFKFMAIGSGVGYRIVFSNDETADKRFSAPFYIVKIRLYASELFGSRKNE